jgi:hypothetical protein
MNEELTPTRAGCRFISSFIIHTSSFAFYSLPCLLPVLAIIWLIFFRG